MIKHKYLKAVVVAVLIVFVAVLFQGMLILSDSSSENTTGYYLASLPFQFFGGHLYFKNSYENFIDKYLSLAILSLGILVGYLCVYALNA